MKSLSVLLVILMYCNAIQILFQTVDGYSRQLIQMSCDVMQCNIKRDDIHTKKSSAS